MKYLIRRSGVYKCNMEQNKKRNKESSWKNNGIK
jgi:hypothetical protein